MIFKNLIIISFLGINLIEAANSSQPSTSKNDKRSQKENREASHEIQNQFVGEEYSRRTLKAKRLGDYQVVYMPRKVAIVPESNYFNKKTDMDESEIFFEKPENKNNVEKKVVKNAYFNNAVDSESDASSVDDNYPRTHPTVTESNARFRDFVSGRATRLFLHLPHKYGDFDGPVVDDKSDVLADQVRKSNYYTSHHPEFDGFMTSSKKEEDIHLWRNESIHPQRTYNPNNEVNPLEPHYNEDVETSQREMATGIGRKIGRDNKSKVFENRNSFSSVNDGCVVS
jgi:hypothetical protein